MELNLEFSTINNSSQELFPSYRSRPDEGLCYTRLVPGSNY